MSGRRGAARESGWISCETGTCGSSSAASRSCPSVILRSRPAGNWESRSTGVGTGPRPQRKGTAEPAGWPGACRACAAAHPALPGSSPLGRVCSHPHPPELWGEEWDSSKSRACGTSSFCLYHFPTIFPVNSELPLYSHYEAVNHLASLLPSIEGKRQIIVGK